MHVLGVGPYFEGARVPLQGGDMLAHVGSFQAASKRSLDSPAWPAPIRAFLQAVVLCRGGDKAVRIRDELHRARRAVMQTAKLAQLALQLTAQPAVY